MVIGEEKYGADDGEFIRQVQLAQKGIKVGPDENAEQSTSEIRAN